MTEEALRADALVRSGDVDASGVRRAGGRLAALVHVDATVVLVHPVSSPAAALEAALGVHALGVPAAGSVLLALVYIC